MKKLELFYFPQCPYCQIVLSAIDESGLKAQVVLKNIHHNPADKEKLIRDTGRGTVPCLYIDGKPMHESRDIANWLFNYSQEINSSGGH